MIDIYIYRDRCLSSYLEYKLSDMEHGASGTRRAASERAKKEDSTTKANKEFRAWWQELK
jgi:hypothetical protein